MENENEDEEAMEILGELAGKITPGADWEERNMACRNLLDEIEKLDGKFGFAVARRSNETSFWIGFPKRRGANIHLDGKHNEIHVYDPETSAPDESNKVPLRFNRATKRLEGEKFTEFYVAKPGEPRRRRTATASVLHVLNTQLTDKN